MSSRVKRRAALLAGLAGSAAMGSVGPENVLLIIDPSSASSMYVGNYYKAARGIPDANVLYASPGAANYAEFTEHNVDAVFGTIRARRTEPSTDMIVLAPSSVFFVNASGYMTDLCFPVGRFGTPGAYTSAFIKDTILGGDIPVGRRNRYFSATATLRPFDSQTTWWQGEPSNDSRAERYFAAGLLGYLGERGNTVEEILAMIDRSVGADGTRPAGIFYFMNNAGDPARNVREPQFNAVITAIEALGDDALRLDAVLPNGRSNVLGVVTGASTPGIEGSSMVILDGAFADHLTSYAGTFDVDAQTKMSSWIRKGCSGTAGTVEEPCNYPGKFPHSRFHLYYAQGLTIGESYLRSMEYEVLQSELYGDPLTRAHAYIPSVSIGGVPGGPVGGILVLSPSATTDNPNASVARHELFFDGALYYGVPDGQDFFIDTNDLTDGYHEVSVVAYDSSAAEQSGRVTAGLFIDNHGLSASLASSSLAGGLGDAFTFDLGASGASAIELRLIHNGRVVASRSTPGSVSVFGQNMGAGQSRVQAEALFADGSTARSAPLEVDVAFSGGGSGPAPVSFGYQRIVLEEEPFVLELPGSFADDPAGATFTLLDGLDQSTLVASTPGAAAGYRVYRANAGASGTDTLTFRVQTPSGSSGIATITVHYGVFSGGCIADCDGDTICDADELMAGALDCNQDEVPDECQPERCVADLAAPFGVLNVFDFLAFQSAFGAEQGCADLAAPFGAFNVFDFLAFQTAFGNGC